MTETITISDWKTLGITLRLPSYRVDQIARDNPHVEELRRHILQNWLDTGHASWAALVDALKCSLIAKDGLATQIAQKYPKGGLKDLNREQPDDIKILQKSPDRYDVYTLLKGESARWDEFACELRVSDNVRTSLSRNISKGDNGKLEEVLRKWVDSQTSSVTWEKILAVLKALKMIRLAGEVIKFLRDPEVVNNYSEQPDFKPFS